MLFRSLFAKLAKVLGHPEWATDSRFATNAKRVENKTALMEQLVPIFLTDARGAWIDRMEAEGVPCSVIHTLPEAVSHPQAVALGIIQRVPGDEATLIGLPLSFDGVRPAIRTAPPAIGEHDADLKRSSGWPQKGT